jgi:hypothetical protein
MNSEYRQLVESADRSLYDYLLRIAGLHWQLP